MTAFRCSDAARHRGDPLAGTATFVRTWLVLEDPGPWGENAWRDARLPHGLGREVLARSRGRGIRPILARRPAGGTARAGGPRRVWVAHTGPARPRLVTTLLEDPRELLDLDPGALSAGTLPDWEPSAEPFFGVCTHGRHDACCAIRGRPVARAAAALEPDLTFEISHIGGDRFAANLLVLPEGLYYGGLDPDSVGTVVRAHRAGEVSLAHLRGRSAWPMAVQAAVIAVRRHTGTTAMDGVRAVAWHREDGQWVVEVDGDAGRWEVPLRRLAPPAVLLTCSAHAPDIPWEFRADTPRRVGAAAGG